MSDMLISLKQLEKTFISESDKVKALDSVDLEVKRGEFIAVMGASGSGKSTLLHLIAGLLTADQSGQLIVGGQDYSTLKESQLTQFRLKNIGLIFQNYNLVRSLNVRENIELPSLIENVPLKKDVTEMINYLGLEKRISHLPRQLSGGEQQRVAIGRALVAEPQIILADEPTGNLDLQTGDDICKLLREIADKGEQTIIMVTHAPHVAFEADRIVMLSEGRVASDVQRSTFADSAALSASYQSILNKQLQRNVV